MDIACSHFIRFVVLPAGSDQNRTETPALRQAAALPNKLARCKAHKIRTGSDSDQPKSQLMKMQTRQAPQLLKS
jgi:hypothetical protein